MKSYIAAAVALALTAPVANAQRPALSAELDSLQAEMAELHQRQGEIIERMRQLRERVETQPSPATPERAATPLPSPVKAQAPEAPVKPSPAKKPSSKTRASNSLVSVRYLFPSASAAKVAQAQLEARGIKSYLAENTGSYRVYAGAYVNERTALGKAREFGTVNGTEPEIFIPE